MNKVYRTVFNETTNTWVAVAEISPAKGKKSRSEKSSGGIGLHLMAPVMVSGMLLSGHAMAAHLQDGTGTNAITIYGAGLSGDDVAKAAGADSFAAGTAAKVYSQSGIALGTNVVSGDSGNSSIKNTVAIGNLAKAKGGNAIAMGQDATATKQSDLAIGDGAKATEGQGTAVGVSNTVSAAGGTAVGNSNTAAGWRSTAIGSSSQADAQGGVAIGNTAHAVQRDAIAIGSNSSATLQNTIAIGTNTKSTSNETIAIGNAADAGSSQFGIAIGSGAKLNNNAALPGKNTAIAIGYQAEATDLDANAFGRKANATGQTSLAIGAESESNGQSSIAVGSTAIAAARDGIAIGNTAKTGTGDNNTAVGSYSEANVGWSTALGTRAYTNANGALAAGTMASAEGQRATAIGSFSFAEGLTSTALGYNAIATQTATSGTAMGTGTVIDGKMSGAWAAAPHANPHQYDNTKRSIVGGEGNYAIGNENIVGNLTKNSVVFGNKIKIGADGATLTSTNPAGQGNSIKSRQETVAYTNATALESVVAIGNEASVSGNRGVAVGNQSGAAQNAVAVGNNAKAKGEAIVAIGQNAGLTSDATSNNTNTRAIMMGVNAGRDAQDINDSILIGYDAGKNLGATRATGNNSSNNIGLGARALQDASGSTNVALATEAGMGANGNNNFFGQVGAGSYVTGNNNVAIGKNAQKGTSANGIIANNSVVLGTEGKATKDNAVAIGKGALAGHESSVALGSASETAAAVATTDATINGVTYSGFAGTAPTSTVSIGKSRGERTLTNVAAGRITDTSTDAINGSQLYSVVNGLGFDVNADNNAAKTHKLGKELAIVAGNTTEATSTSNLKTEVTQDAKTGKTTVTVSMKEAPNFTSVTTTDAKSGNKTVTNGSGVTITPASGNPVSLTSDGLNNGGNKITNVAKGTDGTDAVNVDQLKAAATKVTAGDGIAVTSTVDNATGSTTYKVAADTTPLTVTNGKVTPPTEDDAGKLVTAGDIAKTINNSGFQATAGGNLASGSTATATTVKPGQKVTFAAGDGLTVKQDLDGQGNQSYTYALNAQSVVQSAQTPVVYTKADGTKVYKHTDGNFYNKPEGQPGAQQVQPGDVIASMQNAAGNTTAPTTLANVKDNLADAAAATTNPAGNDRATLAAGNKGHNAATVNDVLNAGFTVQGNGADKDFVTHGDTVNFADGQGTVAKVTSAGGVTKVQFDTPMTYVDPAGSATGTPSNKVKLVGGDATKPVTLGNVADGTVAAGSKEAVNGGQLHDLKEKGFNIAADNGTPDTVKLTETVTYKGDSNIVTTVKNNEIGFKLANSITVGPAAGGNPVTVDGNAGTVTGLTNKTWTPGSITSGRAATEDQLEAAQAAATTKVAAGNGISVNGTQNADGSTTYKVAADTTTLNVGDGTGSNPAGKVITPTGAAANKLATAGDIADAINNSGFQATAGGNLASGSTATATTVKPGQKVTFAAGDGLTVKQDLDGQGNQSYTYALNAQSVVQSAQTPVVYTKADGTKVYKHTDGNFYNKPEGQPGAQQVQPGDVIASMQNAAGNTTAPTTLANVKDNLADAAAATTNPAGNDRATLAAGNKGHNAATVNDVLNAGFTVQGNGADKDFVTHGDTVNFADGQGTVAKVTSAGGVTKVQFDTPMTYVDPAGSATGTPSNKVKLVGGDATKPVTLGNVADGTVAAGSKEAVNGGQLHDLKEKGFNIAADNGTPDTVKLTETVTYKGDSNIVTTVKNNEIGFKLANSITVGPAAGGNPVTVDGNAGTVTGLTNKTWTPGSITSGRAATEDQLEAAQAAATTKVAAGNGISVNGTQNADGSTTYKVAADTTTLNVGDGTGSNPAGKVITPTGAAANKLATAGDIADAINNSGFQATAGGNLASGSTATATTVKPGQKVTFAAGDGLTVKQDLDGQGNQSYTYALNAQSVVQSAQTPVVYTKADGTKVYKHTDGNFYNKPEGQPGAQQVQPGDVIASMQNAAGNTTAPTTLANVKDNLADAAAATTNPAGNDRATLAAGNKGHNAATVNDVLNAGFTVQGNGADKDFVTHGDTVNFADGQGTVAKVTSAGGVTKVQFDTPMTYVDPAGSATGTPSNKVKLVGGDATKPVTLGNVADGTVAAGSKEAVNGGQLHDLKEKGFNIAADNGTPDTVKLTETVTYKGDSNIVTTVKNNEIGFKLANSITVGPAAGGNPVTVDGNAGTVTGLTNKTWTPGSITSGRAATEDQLEAAQAAATTKVAAGNGISVNGTQNADGSTTYKVAADTTTLNVGDGTGSNPAGKVITPTGAAANKLATAGDIADAINNSGFQATAGGNLASGSTATATTVKPGQKVTFAAGDGLTVKQDLDGQGNQSYTYALNAQSVVQSAQTPVVYTKADGTKVYKRPDGKFYDAPTGGNEVAAGNVIASMQDAAGNTTAPTTLANVKSNLADAAAATTNPANNDRTALTANNKGNNAATVNDVLNAGFTVQGNGTDKDFVTHGDTVNFANGQGTVAKVESKDGVTKVSFDTPMSYVDGNGKATTEPSNTVSLVGKDKGKPVQVKNVAKGIADTDAVNVSQLKGAAKALGGGSQINADGSFKAPTYNLVDGKPSDGKTKAYDNVGDALNALNTAANSPLTFAGDTGTDVERKLGSKVNVKGGVADVKKLSSGNIGVVANGTDGLNVKLAKELKGLTSAEFANAAGDVTTVGGNGVTITPKAAGKKPVSLTSNGLNNGGNRITNVAAGTADTDAVNVSQLNQAAAKAANKVEAGSNIVVTPTQNKDGSTTYKVATANDLKANSFTAGGVSLSAKGINAGNKAITNVAAGVNNTDAANVGQVKAAKTEVKAGTNIASVVETKGSNGQSIYTVNADGASVSAGSTALTVTKGKKNANNVTDYAVDLSAKTKADIAKGAAAKDALDTKGLTFTGDTGTTGVKKLGSQVAVTGDSNITTKADASGVNVALKRDLNVDSVTAGNTTVNNGGVTIKSPTTGNPNNTVNLTANGLSNGGKQITNVASGLNGKTVAQIKAEGEKAPEWNNAATVGDLTKVESNVTNISNNYKQIFGGNDNKYVEPNGELTDAGKVALKTYNVAGQKEFVNNSVISAIQNMNEQGIKFFHVNNGQAQIDQAINTVDSSASGRYAVAVGYQAKGTGTDAVAMGSQSLASGQNGIAIGKGAQAIGKNAISIGTGNKVTGNNSGAIGDPTVVTGNNAYSIGNNNVVSANNTYALGSNITAKVGNSVFLGDRTTSFAQTGSTTNATTGVHQAVAGASNYTYLGANDANVAGVKDVKGIVSVGNATETRQIQGVAAGVISANSTDAINGSQLYYTNQAINRNVNNQMVNLGNRLNKKIDDVAADSKAGTAAAMAVAGLPQAYLPGKSMMAVGGSVYRGESGYAIGYSTISDGGNWIVKGTATGNSRGHYGATAAVGYQW